MAKDKVTPEDKLLKIIETPSINQEKHFGLFTKKPALHHDKPELGASRTAGGISFRKLLTLKSANKVLIGVCAAAAVSLAGYFYYWQVQMHRRLADVETVSADFSIFKEIKAYLKVSLDESISAAKKRNIFSFTPPKEEGSKTGAEDMTEGDIYKLLEGIKLVGVIWSETHPEVMVEKEAEEKTYLLSEGDKLGVVTIKKIYQNKVIVEVEGSELELR